MGIVNATPDSFSDGGRYLDPDAAIAHGIRLAQAGAHVIDVGGESTRPGADRVEVAQEQARVLPVITALVAHGIPVSIDTMNAATAAVAVDAGARFVNDVSGGLADPDMLAAVAAGSADVILGHWRGPSTEMYARAEYSDVGREVTVELGERIRAAAAAGISPDRIIVDPGIGFGKTAEQSWATLRSLSRIRGLGHRVLVGTSRKRFLSTALGTSAGGGESDPSHDEAGPSEDRRDLGTAVTSVLAAQAGAWGVRVHDVAATRDALAVWDAWNGAGENKWKS